MGVVAPGPFSSEGEAGSLPLRDIRYLSSAFHSRVKTRLGTNEPLGSDASSQLVVRGRVRMDWVRSPSFFDDVEDFCLRFLLRAGYQPQGVEDEQL